MNSLSEAFKPDSILGSSSLVHWGCDQAYIARFCRGGLVYMASPVTSRAALESAQGDPAWFILQRLSLECAVDLDTLAHAGVCAISPVLHALNMIEARSGSERGQIMHGPLGLLDREGWMMWGGPLLRASIAIVVVNRPGWSESAGIAREIDHALIMNKMVFFCADRPEALG